MMKRGKKRRRKKKKKGKGEERGKKERKRKNYDQICNLRWTKNIFSPNLYGTYSGEKISFRKGGRGKNMIFWGRWNRRNEKSVICTNVRSYTNQ